MDVTDDYALAVRCRARDPLAVRSLWDRFFDQILRVAEARLGPSAEADDVAQETFIRALNSIDSFRCGERLWPWLRAIARNQCLREHAERSRVRQIPAETEDRRSAARFTQLEVADTLRTVLAGLPSRQQTLLTLRVKYEWEYEDIVRLTGESEGTARIVVHRALAKARAMSAATTEELARGL